MAHDGEAALKGSQVQLGRAIDSFKDWFGAQHRAGWIALPSSGQIDVLQPLSHQFCLGMKELRFYIGMPLICIEWASTLPWDCVLVSPDQGRLSLLCDATRVDKDDLPAFSLNFNVGMAEYLAEVVNSLYLDIRGAELSPDPNESFKVTRESFYSLPIKVAGSGSLGTRARHPAPSPAAPPTVAAESPLPSFPRRR